MLAAPDLDRLYDAHAQALFGFLLNLTRSEGDTKDLLQELFCRLAARPGILDGVRDERAFLLRLARNLAVDGVRRRSVRERAAERASVEEGRLVFAPGDTPDEETFRRELESALAALPADQRVVVHFRLWEGMTFECIAEVLEIPLNTAASRYRYGLDKLRARLRPLYEELQ
ncbi:MAG TPA: RNA polymerase sigma factor [Verrucomicrobiota bacterium]|nr:RNA polymerase sigma factor [Verrucomicrobiota bacterium]HNU51828.1 RNA polymerase sigma factor [Verrucomicrobiota bacterium]